MVVYVVGEISRSTCPPAITYAADNAAHNNAIKSPTRALVDSCQSIPVIIKTPTIEIAIPNQTCMATLAPRMRTQIAANIGCTAVMATPLATLVKRIDAKKQIK